MFKLVDEIRVTRKVMVRIPRDGIAFAEEPIKVTFRILDLDQEQELLDAAFTVPLRDDFDNEADFQRASREQRARGNAYSRDLITRVLVDWPADAGIADEDGRPMPFSEDARARLVKIPFVLAALVESYREAVAKKKRGN